ncbi:hypothetical protein HK104_002638 [Borealophlyctis nickersoniae]|nr:hypothetical protein HK104_002638 [Borealophlyctis nickersoniae]
MENNEAHSNKAATDVSKEESFGETAREDLTKMGGVEERILKALSALTQQIASLEQKMEQQTEELRMELKTDLGDMASAVTDPAVFQWSLENIDRCNCIVFWFPWDHPNVYSSLIHLGIQLGRFPMTGKAIFVGVHPKNKEKKLIFDFVKASVPSAYIANNVDKLVDKVVSWICTGVMPANSQTSSSGDSASFHPTEQLKEGAMEKNGKEDRKEKTRDGKKRSKSKTRK